jgi:hypothetical protein
MSEIPTNIGQAIARYVSTCQSVESLKDSDPAEYRRYCWEQRTNAYEQLCSLIGSAIAPVEDKPTRKPTVKQLFKAYEERVFNPALALLGAEQIALPTVEVSQRKDAFFALHQTFRDWLAELDRNKGDKE